MLKVGDVVRFTAAALVARPRPGDWHPLFDQLGPFKFEVVRIQADNLGRPGYAIYRLGYIADQDYPAFPLNRPLAEFYFREHWLEEVVAPKWEVGAKVRVIGNPDDWFGYVREMNAFVGMETTIREAQDGGEHFTIEGDFGVWQWHKSCLELIGEEKAIMPQEYEYKIGDKVVVVGRNGWPHWGNHDKYVGKEFVVIDKSRNGNGPYVLAVDEDRERIAFGIQCVKLVEEEEPFPAANPADKKLRRFKVGDRIVFQHTDPWMNGQDRDFRVGFKLEEHIGMSGKIVQVIDYDRATGQYYQIDWDADLGGLKKPYIYQPDYALEPEDYVEEKEELKVGDKVYIVAPQRHDGVINDRKQRVIDEKGPFVIVRIGHHEKPDWIRIGALGSYWWFNRAALSLNPNGRGGRVKKVEAPVLPPYDEAAALEKAITEAKAKFLEVKSMPMASYATFHRGDRKILVNDNYKDVCHARLGTAYGNVEGLECLHAINYVGYIGQNALLEEGKKDRATYDAFFNWLVTDSPVADTFIKENPKKMFEEGMQIDITKHINQIALACIMVREPWEYKNQLPQFQIGLDGGCSPAASYLLFMCFAKDNYGVNPGQYSLGFYGGHKILDPSLKAKDVFKFLAGKTEWTKGKPYAKDHRRYEVTSEIGPYGGEGPETLISVLRKQLAPKDAAPRGFGRGTSYTPEQMVALGKWIDEQIKEVK